MSNGGKLPAGTFKMRAGDIIEGTAGRCHDQFIIIIEKMRDDITKDEIVKAIKPLRQEFCDMILKMFKE